MEYITYKGKQYRTWLNALGAGSIKINQHKIYVIKIRGEFKRIG